MKGEVCGCDIVALRGDAPPIVIIGELKLRFGKARGVSRPVAQSGGFGTGGGIPPPPPPPPPQAGSKRAVATSIGVRGVMDAFLPGASFKTGHTARSFAAAASSVPSSLAKQKRMRRASGGWSQNGDSGMAATPCRRVSSSQNAVSGSAEIAE